MPFGGIGIDGRNIDLDAGRAPGKRTLDGSSRAMQRCVCPHPRTPPVGAPDAMRQPSLCGLQVAIAQGTDVLVAVHGAALTHLLWLPKHAVVLEIMPPGLEKVRWPYHCRRVGVEGFSEAPNTGLPNPVTAPPLPPSATKFSVNAPWLYCWIARKN